MTSGTEESMRITGPGIELVIRRGRRDDRRGEYFLLAIAGAPDLSQALHQMLREALARPWAAHPLFGTAAPWPWMPMPIDPLALPTWPMQAWLDLWRAWAQAWLPKPMPRQE